MGHHRQVEGQQLQSLQIRQLKQLQHKQRHAPAGRDEEGKSEKAQRDAVLAVTSGFVLPPPFALMHCDMLLVFTKG